MISPFKTAATLVALAFLAGCGQASPAATALPPVASEEPPAATAVLPQTTPEPTAPAGIALQITYTCNDGYIISAGDTKILIDVLYRETYIGCKSDEAELAAMTSAQPPFDGAGLILITHTHADHFDAQIVGAYLQNNPRAVLVTSDLVVDQLRKQFEAFDQVQKRVRSVPIPDEAPVQMTVQDIDLELVSAPADVPNLGFVIRIGGLTLFHTGDSDFTPGITTRFQSYRLPDKQIDLAFVPWWYLGQESIHHLVEDGIRAKNYVPMHFVTRELPGVSKAVLAYYPQAIVFRTEMQTWVFGDPAPADAPPVATAVPR